MGEKREKEKKRKREEKRREERRRKMMRMAPSVAARRSARGVGTGVSGRSLDSNWNEFSSSPSTPRRYYTRNNNNSREVMKVRVAGFQNDYSALEQQLSSSRHLPLVNKSLPVATVNSRRSVNRIVASQLAQR